MAGILLAGAIGWTIVLLALARWFRGREKKPTADHFHPIGPEYERRRARRLQEGRQ